MHDLLAGLGLTQRTIDDAQIGGAAAHVVQLRRRLRAPVADVWDACTNPEPVRRWFLPLSGDLRAGGTFALEGNASGEITLCLPPHRLELTWQAGKAEPSRVSLELTAVDGETDLVLRHAVPDDEQWAQYGPGAVGVGWEGAVAGLAGFIAGTERRGDPTLLVDFLRQSAGLWGTAHEAAGAAPQVAQAAARQTSTFYAPADGQR